MQKVTHGQAYFEQHVVKRVLELMRLQCSAKRSAYQAIHKHGLSGNDVKQYAKKNYMSHLNQRYIADACSQAGMINQEFALFGGRRSWKQLQTGTISKEDWQQKRNNQLYSRGDATKQGNPNIRVFKDRIMINDPAGRGRWLEGKLYLDGDWNNDMYSVQILYRNNKFEVVVLWQQEEQNNH